MAICLWINFNERCYLIILWHVVVGQSTVEIWLFCVCPYLFKKIFKITTETCTLLQKSSKKSYERIHQNSIFYVSCRKFLHLSVACELWKIHRYRRVSFSRRKIDKNQQKPTLYCKNPQKNHMNAYTTARFFTFRAKQNFEN